MIPPATRVVVGRWIAFALLGLGVLGGAFVAWRVRSEADVGLAWLWPAACGIALAITLAYCFGIASRLPRARPDAGQWVGLPGSEDGDLSGHTMPGFVRAHPFFSGFLFLFTNAFAAAVFRSEIAADAAGTSAGLAVGTFVWWFWILCFSRGWIREGD